SIISSEDRTRKGKPKNEKPSGQAQQPTYLVRRHRLPIIPRNPHLTPNRIPKAHPPRYQSILLALLHQRLSRLTDLVARPLDPRLLVLGVSERADADGGPLKDCKVVGAPPGLLTAAHDGDAWGVVVVAGFEVVGERCFGFVDGGGVAGGEPAGVLCVGGGGEEEKDEAKEGREKKGRFMH
ncbi:hypothetical protein P167DRAFT_584315, partial [Morchella conica CCBAS932]